MAECRTAVSELQAEFDAGAREDDNDDFTEFEADEEEAEPKRPRRSPAASRAWSPPSASQRSVSTSPSESAAIASMATQLAAITAALVSQGLMGPAAPVTPHPEPAPAGEDSMAASGVKDDGYATADNVEHKARSRTPERGRSEKVSDAARAATQPFRKAIVPAARD